jgi:Ca-activated chloride channel family protein
VLDSASTRPIASATVTLEGTRCGALTDSLGRFRLSGLRPDSYTVVARQIGYGVESRHVRVRSGADTSVTIELASAPPQLQQVVTTGAATAPEASGAYLRLRGAKSINGFAVPSVELGSEEVETADELLVFEAGAVAAARREHSLHKRADVQAAVDADARAPEPEATQGTLRARALDGTPLGDFPLQHTDVSAEISGSIARTVVVQRYANPYRQVIEAVYIFPLPSLGAVNDFVMRVGSRKIIGLVRTRDEAERIYRDARARGQTASLLTQERPNIFTQSVANIEPGGTVGISITYFERLPYEKGEYEFVFPMVVGPRYNPGQTAAPPVAVARPLSGTDRMPGHHAGGGCASAILRADTTAINPPVLPPGVRGGHDISLRVTLDAGLPITQLAAIAHRVDIEAHSPSRQVIRLASSDAIPNRDFVLRWSVAGAETRFGVLSHASAGKGYFSLTMQPPLAPRDEQVTPREITFIMDVSGSMSGAPIAISKELIERTLDRLRPDDHFNLVYFAGGNAQLWERARPNTSENVAEAKRFLASMAAGGGTEMLAGVRRALGAHHEPEFVQMFVFLTDGYVGNEAQILEVIKTERGAARFFGFGIGGSVNRYLIDGIGEHGGGMSQVVIPRDTAHRTRAVNRLFDAIDSPVLVDVAIDWNGLAVRDVYPAKPRDLFAGQVIDVVARYDRPANGTVFVTGRVGGRRVRYPVRVELPAEESRNAALAPTWARLRIHDLSGELLTADSAGRARLRQEITDLALGHRLVSQYTAFVAVDSSRIVGDGRPLRVMQPVELPEGVSYEGIFGEKPSGRPVRIDAWGTTLQQTASGKIRVVEVAADGPAARGGVRAGAQVTLVNGVAVHTLAQLEGLLLQSTTRVSISMERGGEVILPSP